MIKTHNISSLRAPEGRGNLIKKIASSETPRNDWQKGQILALLIVSLSVILTGVLVTIAGSRVYFETSKYSIFSEAALNLAEAGIDKAIASLNASGGNYNGEQETFLGDGSYSVGITEKDASTKIITATGYMPSKTSPKAKRTVTVQISLGVGTAFVYGIQVGEGGLQLGNSNTVTGSVYSNGNITAGNSNEISGDAWVAGGPQPDPDQQTDCVTCQDFIFGKTVDGNSVLDVAQSFTPSITQTINKVSLKIKKFGTNHPNLTVRVLQDDNGKPNKNAALTEGTLYESLVTSEYPINDWINVTFNSSPTLNANTPYWLMIDTSSDSDNYWSWHNDLAQSYTGGLAKWSPKWDHGSPTWTTINPGDLSFKIYMGGIPTAIRAGANKIDIGGDAHANTIENADVTGDAYYQTIISSTVGGTSHPASADPPPKVFPISEANIEQWREDALENGGGEPIVGDINNCVAALDSSRIIGNVTFDSGCNLTVTSPIHIVGNLTLNSNNQLKLASSYGAGSGVIVVDGIITMNSNNRFLGTGTGSSLLMALSTYDSRTSGIAAIALNSQGNTGVFYANNGVIEPGTNNQFKELTAWGIRLINGSTINYETGLSSTIFTSGPTGAYSIAKGTYKVE